jgi:aminoglycoside/choline kinase family phosphotransferase
VGFNAVVLLRRLQALGAYVRIATEKQAPAYLEKIPPALETLRGLRAAGHLDFGLPALDDWLEVLLRRT